MFTTKDFRIIAKCCHSNLWYYKDQEDLKNKFLDALSDSLTEINPRFNKEKFIEACVTGKGL